jgi:hypothetical protein
MYKRARFNHADFELGRRSYTFYEAPSEGKYYCTEVERKSHDAKIKERYLRSSYFARLRTTLILYVLLNKVGESACVMVPEMDAKDFFPHEL